ncbi:MAG: thioredoxin family protein [Anaerovoracaceae bacterium]|jgi:bacillithiol system protein YtxJ
MKTKKPIEIQSKETLNQLLEENQLFVLYFSSTECGVCHAVLPRLINLLEEYNVEIATIDINRLREISGQYLVFTVPTILLIKNGKEILRESRFIDFTNISRFIGEGLDQV